MAGDLLGATDRGDVLGPEERGTAALAGQRQQVFGDQRDGPARALLPRRVSCGIHDDLTHDPPAGVMGLAAVDEKAGQRLGDDRRASIGAVYVQVTQRLGDAAAVLNCPRDLARRAPRLLS